MSNNKHITVDMLQYFKGLQDAANDAKFVAKAAGMGLTHNDLTDELKAQYDAAQANVLEAVKVNGTALTIGDKAVNITIAEGTTNGTLNVNGAEVTFHGAADLFTQMATMIGDDANKSARTIANEELAKQLVPEGAKEALDTLQEIAAWIQQHPDDAAAMNTAIGKLETILAGIGGEGDASATVVAYVAAQISAAQTDLTTEINKKVDKAEGMGLSHNDFTDALKAKLEAIEEASTADIDAIFTPAVAG